MKRLLIVVDFQNDFIDGTLGFKKAETLVDLTKTLCIMLLPINTPVHLHFQTFHYS